MDMVDTKYLILNSCADLCNYLCTGVVNNPFTLYSNKIILEDEKRSRHTTGDVSHSIRIWESKTAFLSWYNDMCSSDFIGALDYDIRPNDIMIKYISVNDDECCYVNKPIDQTDAIKIQSKLLEYAKKRAKDENKEKVVMDVHENLRLYNKYYKQEGFQITGRKADDNPYWQEVEYYLPKDT